MIVFQIDVNRLSIQPAERDPPIAARVDGVAALIAPDERVKPEAGQVHVFGARCVVECAQDVGYPRRVLHAEPASVSGGEETFQSLVSERPDHA